MRSDWSVETQSSAMFARPSPLSACPLGRTGGEGLAARLGVLQLIVAPETLLRKDQSVDVTPVSQLTVQPPCTASITDDQPDVEILPGVQDHQVNDSIAVQQFDLGSITKPLDVFFAMKVDMVRL